MNANGATDGIVVWLERRGKICDARRSQVEHLRVATLDEISIKVRCEETASHDTG